MEGNIFGSSKAKNGVAFYTIEGKKYLNSGYAYMFEKAYGKNIVITDDIDYRKVGFFIS